MARAENKQSQDQKQVV